MAPKQHPHKKKKNDHGGNIHRSHHHNDTSAVSLKSVSHALSWALRHAAPDLGLSMTSDGYCPVHEILAHTHPKLKRITSLEQQIRPVVETNDKQRFRLELRPKALFAECNDNKEWSIIELTTEQAAPVSVPETEAATPLELQETSHLIWCVRANQGHSIQGINADFLLQGITPDELASLPVIVHGTYMEAWQQIQASGALSRMNRTHIHCASGFAKESGVISGMRTNCQVHIFVSGPKCAADGIRFFRSDNGVLLTAGVQDMGLLPLQYLSHVTDSQGKFLLDQRLGDNENETRKERSSEDTERENCQSVS